MTAEEKFLQTAAGAVSRPAEAEARAIISGFSPGEPLRETKGKSGY
ncbi:MAG: hypothetical protein ACREV9_08145 [Burkholderiales bacterium]